MALVRIPEQSRTLVESGEITAFLASNGIEYERVDQIPVTPEKILRALKAKAAGKPARVGPDAFPEIPWPEPLLVTPPDEGGDGRASNEPAKRSARKADAGVEAKAGVRA